MNIPVSIGRLLLMLPCGMCGDPQPHAFRVMQSHGITVLCGECNPTQDVRENPVDLTKLGHAPRCRAAVLAT